MEENKVATDKQINQCDGCRRGLPISENGYYHNNPDSSWDFIGCTARLYGNPSSAPNSPEVTRLSGEQAEERTASEGRACPHCKWTHGYHRHGCPNFQFVTQRKTPREFAKTWILDANRTLEDGDYDFAEAYADSECSRLASRVEELEKGLHQAEMALSAAVMGLAATDDLKYALECVTEGLKSVKLLAGAHAEEKPQDV